MRKEKFKSEGERKIAYFFRKAGIKYIYEHGVFILDDEKPKIWHPDFYLPEYAVYVEYYGLVGNPDYDQGIKKKTEVYASIGIEVIPVFPNTFNKEWEAYILKQILEISKRRMKNIEGNPVLDKCIVKYGVEDIGELYRRIRNCV